MYEVIEHKVWKHTNGRTASLYGSVPYLSAEEKLNWKVETVGFTVRNNHTNTVGIGRKPWATKAEAEAWLNSRQ
jgi:hypothetical protein